MEAKVFSQSREGIKVHWTVEHETVDGLTAATSRLMEWLDTNEFRADNGFGNGSSTGTARQAAPARSQQPARSARPPSRNGNGPMRVQNPDAEPTEGQIKALYAISKNLGWSREDLENWLGNVTPSELTRGEASKAIDDLHKMES